MKINRAAVITVLFGVLKTCLTFIPAEPYSPTPTQHLIFREWSNTPIEDPKAEDGWHYSPKLVGPGHDPILRIDSANGINVGMFYHDQDFTLSLFNGGQQPLMYFIQDVSTRNWVKHVISPTHEHCIEFVHIARVWAKPA